MKVLVFLGYALFIGFMSLRQSEGPGIEHLDKVMHFGAYGVFAVLGFFTSKNTKTFFFVCIAIILYGGFLEWAQSYVVDRQMSLYDFVANSAGVLVGATMVQLIKNRRIVRAPGR